MLAQMLKTRYNYTSKPHKSGQVLVTLDRPFSTCERGARTMNYSTLPLFSLQPETKLIPLTRGQVAIVDASDYDFLMQFKWCANKIGRTFYAVRKALKSNGKRGTIYMHQMIAGNGVDPVDHVDMNGLNNTRCNLRLATHQQNLCNQGLSKANSSGYKGVSWDKPAKKWRATIQINDKKIYLGLFANAEEAGRAYDQAARELHGEFARLNTDVG